MQVTIHGPNLPDQSKGEFHVHSADCGDNRKYGPDHPWTIEAKSRDDVGDALYEDMIAEGSMEPGEGQHSCWFAPCTADLK